VPHARRRDGAGSGQGLLRASFPFWLTAALAIVNSQGDVLIAGSLLDSDDVAPYTLASKLSLILLLPVMALTQVLAPSIPKLDAAGDRQALERIIRRYSTVLGLPTIVAALVLITVPGFVLHVLLPPEYGAAAAPLAILAVGPLTKTLTGPNGFTLLMLGHGAAVARLTVVTTLVQVAAMVAAAALWGPVGLAVASSAGTVVLSAGCAWLLRTRAGLSSHILLGR
jgi:O-antigen/teichoic acid export membrane protein